MGTWFATLFLTALLALAASWFLLPRVWADVLLRSARRSAGMRSFKVRAGGLDWHCLEGGAGPVLVMLHGFGATADHWLWLAWRLKRDFRVIAPDLVGFGDSDPGTGATFNVESQAARLIALLEALGVDECLVAGSSMGGWVATALAAAQPGRVQCLWLQAPLGVRDCEPSPFLAAADRRGGLPLLASRRDYEQYVVQAMFVRQPWIPFPLADHYARDAVRRLPAAQRIFQQVRNDSAALESLARKVHAPVLLQWGRQDRVVDVSGAETLHRAFSDVEIQLQEGIGHLPMLESPGESLRMFLDFHGRRFGPARNKT